jgi:hypothetical protein
MKRLAGFDDKANGLIELLHDYEWTGRVTSKGHWLGKAPDGKTTITIPSKMDNPSRAERNARATFKKWVRDAFPEIAESLDAVEAEEDPIIRDTLEGKAHRLVNEQGVRQITKAMQREYDAVMGKVEWPVRTPWLAHKASNKVGGTRYQSEAVVQRTHSDGSIDFECAFEGCEYESQNPRGVAVHYGKAHTMKGQVPPASQDNGLTIDPEYTEPILTRDYRPTERMVSALMEVLAKLNGHGTDREKAVEILRWMALRPDIEHTTRELEPLSDGEIVIRMRRLLAIPDLSDALEERTVELSVVEGERDEAVRQRDEANARLVKVERDLESLRELLDSVGR